MRSFVTSATFRGDDPSYNWMMDWILEQDYSKKTLSFLVKTSTYAGKDKLKDFSTPRLFYFPSTGIHFLKYKNKWIMFSIESTKPTDSINKAERFERLVISTLGRNRELLCELIETSKQLAIEKDKQRTAVYHTSEFNDWDRSSSRPVRPFDSVILKDGLANLIYEDCLKVYF
jgi:chaperone BCS1